MTVCGMTHVESGVLTCQLFTVLVRADDSLKKLTLLLNDYGINMKDLTPEQLDNLPAALKQLQMESPNIGF